MWENGFLMSVNRLGNCFFLSLWSVQAAGDKTPERLYLLQFSPETVINCQSQSALAIEENTVNCMFFS